MEFKLAVLASGAGSTAQKLLESGDVVVVVTNNPDAGVIERAEKLNIPVKTLRRKDYWVEVNGEVDKEASRAMYGTALQKVLERYKVTYIGQHGWSIITPRNVVEKYLGRIVNSHPAPLDPGHPDFGGVGMHGLAVHQAVLNFFAQTGYPKTTEVTLHLVTPDEQYDKGLIEMVSSIKIEGGDTAESLQERVKLREVKRNLEFWFDVKLHGMPRGKRRSDRLILPKDYGVLKQAKLKAIEQYPKG